MGTFTGPALNGFVQGQRLYDQDARIEEKHDWARDENDRAEDSHIWAGETHNTMQNRRGLENKALERAEADDQEYRGNLTDGEGNPITPGKVKAIETSNQFKDNQNKRKKKQEFAENQGTTIGGMEAQGDIVTWKKNKYEADLQTMRSAVQQAIATGDYSLIAKAMSNTFHGTTPDNKNKNYVFKQTENGFIISNPDKNNVALKVERQPGETMKDAIIRSIFPVFQNVDTYFSQEADIAKAQRLASIENQLAMALSDHKLENQKELVSHTEKVKRDATPTVTLPSAIGNPKKIPRKQVEGMLDNYFKILKGVKTGGNSDFDVESDYLKEADAKDRTPVIQQIINISKDQAYDAKTRATASQALTLMHALGYIPKVPQAINTSGPSFRGTVGGGSNGSGSWKHYVPQNGNFGR